MHTTVVWAGIGEEEMNKYQSVVVTIALTVVGFLFLGVEYAAQVGDAKLRMALGFSAIILHILTLIQIVRVCLLKPHG